MSSDGGDSPPFLPRRINQPGRGRLEETHSTSETQSQGRRKVTLASRSLANAELGVIAGVIQEELVTRMGLDWARLIRMVWTSEVKTGKR